MQAESKTKVVGANEKDSERSATVVGRIPIRLRQNIEQNVLDSLVFRGAISRSDMEAAIEDAEHSSEDLESILLERYQIPKSVFGMALSDFYQCPYLPYDERTVLDPDLLRTLSLEYLTNHLWLPIARCGSLLDVLTNNPNDPDKAWDIRRSFPGANIRYSVGLRRDIEQFLKVAKSQNKSSRLGSILSELVHDVEAVQAIDPAANIVDENDSAIVRLANHLIIEAERLGASDIHIEPYTDRKDTVVRFRVDGTCFTFMKIPAGNRRAIISRLKSWQTLILRNVANPKMGKFDSD